MFGASATTDVQNPKTDERSLWVRARLNRVGFDIGALASSGGAAWLFGSRACGRPSHGSDWDVLLVVPGKALRRRCEAQLDIVSVSLAEIASKWPQSDLASHVAHYGLHLMGQHVLPLEVSPRIAAARKTQLVFERSARLDQLWGLFDRTKQRDEAVRLRRDIQRARRLNEGIPVPATVELDEEWVGLSNANRRSCLCDMKLSRRLEAALMSQS
jgi:hypothetical protein